MKTRSIARGIVGSVAALLGVMAAGCSAESGDEAAQIGSSAEALTVTGIGSPTHTFADVPAAAQGQGVAACTITANSLTFMMTFGGANVSGASPTNTVRLYDKVNNTWITPTVTGAPTARYRAKLISDPANADKCVLVGGLDSSNHGTDAHTATLSFASGTYTVAFGSAHTFTSRGKHEVVPCGSGKLMAIGGVNTSGSVLSANTIEIWDGSTTWTAATHSSGTATELNTKRFDFAAIKDPTSSTNRYLIAGGNNGLGKLSSIELIDATSSCDVANTTRLTTASTLAHSLEGFVLLPEGHSDTYVTAGGESSGLRTDSDKIAVSSWSVPTVTVTAAGGPTLPAGMRFPAFANIGTSYFLVGGDNGSGTPISDVLEFVVTANSGTTGSYNSGSLAEARLFPAVPVFSSKVYVLTGKKDASNLSAQNQEIGN